MTVVLEVWCQTVLMTSQPPPLPPCPRQSRIDLTHLRILAVFHGIFVIVNLLFLLIGLVTFATSERSIDPRLPASGASDQEGWIYLLIEGWFFGEVFGNLLSAVALGIQKFRTLSIIVASLNCLHLPFGTILAVFTFIVIFRPSVRELYRKNTPQRAGLAF